MSKITSYNFPLHNKKYVLTKQNKLQDILQYIIMMHLTIFNTAVGCFAWAKEVFHGLFCIPMTDEESILLSLILLILG